MSEKIVLLDMNKVKSVLKAGFSRADTFFKAPVSKGQYRYVNGVTPEVAAVQQRNPNPSPSMFTGKTFSSRK